MDMVGMELTSKAKILVLFANAYDMQDERGRALTGCSVHYLFWGENGEPLMSRTEFNPSKPVGIQRSKCSMDVALREKLVVAPGIYEGTFKTVTGGDGKPVLKLVDVAFVSFVDFVPRENPGFACPGMLNPPEWQQQVSGIQQPAADKSAEPAEKAQPAAKAGK